jgi:hypothetical protein
MVWRTALQLDFAVYAPLFGFTGPIQGAVRTVLPRDDEAEGAPGAAA